MKNKNAFTLVELSIVLVILGLIISGVIVGQSLIFAARITDQVSQIQQYHTATQSFQTKYDCLPGDCSNAQDFGFKARGSYPGTGNGDGFIEGNWGGYATNNRGNVQNGENTMFWNDLFVAGYIRDTLNSVSCTAPVGNYDSSNIHEIFPQSRLGSDMHIIVFSASDTNKAGIPYFGLTGMLTSNLSGYNIGLGNFTQQNNVPVEAAYGIDRKMDDGNPLTGTITAQRLLNGAPASYPLAWVGTATGSTAAAASTSTCYDNLGNTANPVTYSMSVNGGRQRTCSLAFEW